MKNRIRVLIATPFGRGGQGGIDRLMDMITDELSRAGDPSLEVQLAPTRGKRGLITAQAVFLGFLGRMTWLCLSRRLDVVHINLASNGSTVRKLIVFALARTFGVRTVIHLHGPDFRQFWNSANAVLSAAIGAMFRKADRIIVLGNVWRDFIAARLPETADRIVILPNAVPRPVLPHVPLGGGVRILFLGRLGSRKGIPQLVKALYLLKDVAGWSAVLAGDGDVEATRCEVERLGLAARVEVPGWAEPAAAARLLAASDILTLPSFDENLPMSVIEAMASGLAIVATPVGAVGDIVTHGETGLLVEPGNIEDLAAALKQLILNPRLRTKLGRQAQAVHRERLDIQPYVQRLTALWDETAKLGNRIPSQ